MLGSKVSENLSVECPRTGNTPKDPHMCDRYSFLKRRSIITNKTNG